MQRPENQMFSLPPDENLYVLSGMPACSIMRHESAGIRLLQSMAVLCSHSGTCGSLSDSPLFCDPIVVNVCPCVRRTASAAHSP